jgi:quercetin dioxygenase-like cupin family protein
VIEKEKLTRGGRVVWVERDVQSLKVTSGESLIERLSIYDPKFPPDMNEVRGGPTVIVEGEGFTLELTKRRKGMEFWHRNLDQDELIFIVKGKAIWRTELGTYEMQPGDLLIIPKGVAHRVEPVDENEYVALEIKSLTLRKAPLP